MGAGGRDAVMAARDRRARAKARLALAPGYDGQREHGAVFVQDPYSGLSELKTVNTRHDPITQMKARGRLKPAEEAAALKVAALVQALGLAGARAIDPSEPFVDRSGRSDPISDRMVRAGAELAALVDAIGADHAALVIRTAGYGETVTRVAIDWEADDARRVNGACSQATRTTVADTLIAALGAAAIHFGFLPPAVDAARRRRILGQAAPGARPALDLCLRKAVETGPATRLA